MKVSRRLRYALTMGAIAVALGWIIMELGPDSLTDAGRLVLFPGLLLDLVLSGNVHSGFGGIIGPIVTSIAAVMFWSVMAFLLVTVFERFKRQRP